MTAGMDQRSRPRFFPARLIEKAVCTFESPTFWGCLLGICLVPCVCRGQAATDPESSPNSPSQQEELRQNAKKVQDSFRVRLAIPHGGIAESPSKTSLPGGQTKETVESNDSKALGVHGQDLILGALLCLAAVLGVRKLAPETAEEVLGSRLSASRGKNTSSTGEALADEQSFAKFLVGFKAGPAAEQTKTPAPEEGSSVSQEHGGDKTTDQINSASARLFLSSTPEHLLAMWNLLQVIQRESTESARRKLLGDLCVQLRDLKYAAAAPQFLPIWQVTSLIEGLVGQLAERDSNFTANTVRTVTDGLDLLVDLCQPGLNPNLSTKPAIRLLAVDDDVISRRAVATAVKHTFGQPDLASNAEAALAQVSSISYDVIFLDILMPGIDGFELCSRIRRIPLNERTPVLFITSQTDFETREKSTQCGGNDFIAKPFLTFEITLRALILALRARLQKSNGTAAVGTVGQLNAVSV